MMPESTSPVPAVASRSSPALTTSASPAGAATTVAGPLRSTTARSWPPGGGPRRSGRRPGGAGQDGELAVVGREHGRRGAVRGRTRAARASQRTGRRRRPPRARAARPRAGAHRRGGVGRGRGPARRRGRGSGRGRRGRRERTRPAATARADRLGGLHRIGGHAGRRQPHHAGTGPLGRPRREVGGAEHARRAGHDPHRGPPLVGVDGPRPAATAATSDTSTRCAADGAGRPMSATSTSPASCAARGEQEARLQRRERHGAVGREHRPLGRAGQTVDATRDVDGQHGGAAGVGRRPGPAEAGAVGGVDHEIAGRDHAGGRRRRRARPTCMPQACSSPAAARPSLPLLPLPATTTTRRP